MRRKKKFKKTKTAVLFLTAFFLITLSLSMIWVSTLEIPSLSGFKERSVAQSTKIYARDAKTVLFDVHKDIRRTHVPLSKISRHIKNATIAIEDTDFYNHFGIRPKAIMRAVIVNLLTGEYAQGGSTITQQVIKNALLSREKTVTRKIKEWILAIKLERILSKDQILELYLNEAPYGGNILGVEEASRRFFGKGADTVTLAEAAYIAALPKAPSYYSPYGKHKDELDARKNTVLYEMYQNGFITKQEYTSALNEKVEFKQVDNSGIKAPHFVFEVINRLVNKYGEDAVYSGGLKVITTLDWELQDKAQEIVKKYALQNEEKFNAENASAVVIDSQTGEVLTMVGSRDYFDEKIDGKFNIATAKRQPGSTFKPIVYVRAFEKGYTPSTVLFDVPTQFSSTCPVNDFTMENNCYAPKNYDDEFKGPITLRDALAQSRNIPAVKLLYMIGIKDAINTAKSLGISTLNEKPEHYGLPLALGGGEVSLLELTNVYATFGNDGKYNKPVMILSVEDAKGDTLYKYTPNPSQVIDMQAVRELNDVLTDEVARRPAYGRNSFYFPNDKVAVKTGTTNDYKDVWVMGYTPKIALGTWAGNNDNTPIVKKVAGFVLAPMWKEVMTEALKKYGGYEFIPPEPIRNTKPIFDGTWYYPNISPPVHSILYWVDRDNPTGTPPKNPEKEAIFQHFEYGVQTWFAANYGRYLQEQTLPNATRVNPASTFQQFSIITPGNNSILTAGRPVQVTVAHSGFDLKEVKYYLNDQYLATVSTPPFSVTFVPGGGIEKQTLRAIGVGRNYPQMVSKINFTVTK